MGSSTLESSSLEGAQLGTPAACLSFPSWLLLDVVTADCFLSALCSSLGASPEGSHLPQMRLPTHSLCWELQLAALKSISAARLAGLIFAHLSISLASYSLLCTYSLKTGSIRVSFSRWYQTIIRVKKAIHLNKWEKTAAACVWTNPKPEFIELKYYGEIVYGEREGMRVWVWGWVGVGAYPACMWRSSPLLCAFLVLNSGHKASWQVDALANRAISPTLTLLRVVPHYMIL